MDKTPKFGGVPSYFRYGCLEAQRGGSSTYFTPAWHLAIHTEENMPDDMDDEEEWEGLVDELREAAGNEDAETVWDWYSKVFPKCMVLVPPRRKDQFAKGVFQAWEDGRL